MFGSSMYAFSNMPSNSNNNTQTKGLDCEAQENCRVVKEEKNGKKFIRFVTFRICTESYHALCVNCQNLSDHEFAKEKDLFCCTRCFNFVEVVSENIASKVSSLIKNIVNESLSKIAPSYNNEKKINDILDVLNVQKQSVLQAGMEDKVNKKDSNNNK